MEDDRIAIFIDAENLGNWLKIGGAEVLLEELSAIGQTVVRRAYGIWTNLTSHQAGLNRLGFELIHSYHPVKGKNSTDIQMTVDVMEYIWRVEDIKWFVLATGDSDFSPLFRRLREMSKDVIGVGPRSALSESVKSSCTRFIYTDAVIPKIDDPEENDNIQTAFDDAADLVDKVLETFDTPIRCSLLKSRMRNIDSAFDEKALGFTSFTAFLQSLDGVNVYYDERIKAWFVSVSGIDSSSHSDHSKTDECNVTLPTPIANTTLLIDKYRSLLRKKQWHTIPKNTLRLIYDKWVLLGALPKPELIEKLLDSLDGEITAADIKKTVALIFKARLITIERDGTQDDAMWSVMPIPEKDLFTSVDKAMIHRLIGACADNQLSVDLTKVRNLMYSSVSGSVLKAWIEEGKKVAVVDL